MGMECGYRTAVPQLRHRCGMDGWKVGSCYDLEYCSILKYDTFTDVSI